MSSFAKLLAVLMCCGWLACDATQAEPERGVAQESPAPAPSAPDNARADLPALCKRPGDDVVRDVFCAADAPAIGGMADLQERLSMQFDPAYLGPVDQPAMLQTYDRVPELGLVLLNASTSLSSRLISTLNPRAILLTPDATLAFNRGVQQVELFARTRGDRSLNMYLLRFEQACNSAPSGCGAGDLYTPSIESGWTKLSLQDAEDLKNTPSDCRQCHQRARPDAIFLMRELGGPWTHFFFEDRDPPQPDQVGPELTGTDVVRAYQQAKGDEPYANIPWAAIRATVGLTLESVVPLPQPLVFDGAKITNERWPWTMEAGLAKEPVRSETWYRQYEEFKRGEHLALPHYDTFPSDAAKLAKLTDAYRSFRKGKLAGSELPDLSDVYSDDPQKLAELGFLTEPGATPAQTLVMACAQCHNDVLDQSLSRARFNVDLARLGRAQLDTAIERIALPLDDPRHMPPREFRQLAADATAPLLEYLRAGQRSAEDDALLGGAATMGMARPASR